MKKCKVCGKEKDLDQYYTYKKYGTTYINGKCKVCTLAQNKKYRDTTGYDRARYQKDKEKIRQLQREYSKTEEGRKARLEASRRYRESEHGKLKQKARAVVNHAIRDGKLIKPETCMDCGRSTQLEAHHKDYNKPLDVDWICKNCHENRHHLNEGSTSE